MSEECFFPFSLAEGENVFRRSRHKGDFRGVKLSIKPPIRPMLCHDFEVNGSVLKENGLDGEKVTAAYRKAVAEGLRNLMVRGFVAERKGGIASASQRWLVISL